MTRFRTISEGITDPIVIGNLLVAYFNNPDIDFEPLVPKDKEPFGWTRVFDYCKSLEFKEAFDFCDYIIIQIDTDKRADWGFSGISEVEAGNKQSFEDQVNAVIKIFITIIGENFYKEHENQMIFAIAIESIECWILPYYANQNSHQQKHVNCLNTLNSYLSRKHHYTIDKNQKFLFYTQTCEPLKKKRFLKSKYLLNPSLEVFIKALDNKFGLMS